MSDEKEIASGLSRRGFIVGAGCTVALLGVGGAAKYASADPVCRLPGGQNDAALIAACIHCEKCREVCPQNVVAPGHLEHGIINMRTPRMNFKAGYCDFCKESNNAVPRCEAVCTTGALKLASNATAETTILGKAIITRKWCLGWGDTGCRTCVENCPYEALVVDEENRPHVIYDKCNGCGKCEYVCISTKVTSIKEGATDRAIVVRPVELYDRLKEGLA